VKIEVNRDSVCMADDVRAANSQIFEFSETDFVLTVMKCASSYIPTMYHSV
jgi:hypothetical protein